MEYDEKTGEFSTALTGSTKDGEGIRSAHHPRKRRLKNSRRRIASMIRKEFATVDNVRAIMHRLQILAFGGRHEVEFDDGKMEVTIEAKPQYMAMLMDRVLGPVRNDEAVEKAVEKRLAEMLELAEREARRRSDK